ncbi:MAG: discoidin domain-containing protein [Chitinispirillaceae bacterium]
MNSKMLRFSSRIASVLLFCATCLFSQPQVLVNQVGYEKEGAKRAVIQYTDSFTEQMCHIVDNQGNVVDSVQIGEEEAVDGWKDRLFRVVDFSSFNQEGVFSLSAGTASSPSFEIAENLLLNKTAPEQISFFYGMRNDSDDEAVPLFESEETRNVNGGWSDATGDLGKHLSHLSFANYFNPQQIPMVIWSILHAMELYPEVFAGSAQQEAAYGADYLMRVLDPEGFFYMSVFDNWGYESREICAWSNSTGDRSADYQAAMREGGGMSIAALARAYNAGISGEFSASEYLEAAQTAYAHLKANPTAYQDDGKENIIDDYCGLMAASELYNATGDDEYLEDARSRAVSLLSRQSDEGWFYTTTDENGDGTRPFYHAAEEGFPVVALARYVELTDPQDLQTIRDAVKKNLLWYESITYAESNPFEYAKMYRAANAAGVAGTDLALNRTVDASSVERENNSAEMAVDGNSTTRWSSDFENDQWISVDLGQVYTVDKVVLNWEEAHGVVYNIEVSDDAETWTTVFEETENSSAGEKIHTFPSVEAQYVRMYGIERVLEWGGFSLYDFEVYGEEASTPSPYQAKFFIPQQNETGYWWQGENARLSSMAAAFILGAPLADPTGALWENTFFDLAVSQFDWILGKNPFDVCMMYGFGENSYPHYPGLAGYAFDNIEGGICNGITAMRSDQNDLEWMPYHMQDGDSTWADWRWIEQWLPHNAWYLTAMTSLAHRIDNPIEPINVIRVPLTKRASGMFDAVTVSRKALHLDFSVSLERPLDIALYSMKGRKVASFSVNAGKKSAVLKLSPHISAGMYVLNAEGDKKIGRFRSRVLIR